MSTVKLDLDEYNRLRDRDGLLSSLEADEVVFYRSTWNGGIRTISKDKKEAWTELTKNLADARFQLQMANEQIYKLKEKAKKKWYHL